jgi:hypothetical protein
MKRLARFVNFYFCSIVDFDDPNCLFLLTISLGRRTIANRRSDWQGFFGWLSICRHDGTDCAVIASLERDPSLLLSLDAHYLLEGVHDFNQIALCVHDRVDIFVRHRDLVDDVGILAALDALGGANLVG